MDTHSPLVCDELMAVTFPETDEGLGTRRQRLDSTSHSWLLQKKKNGPAGVMVNCSMREPGKPLLRVKYWATPSCHRINPAPSVASHRLF